VRPPAPQNRSTAAMPAAFDFVPPRLRPLVLEFATATIGTLTLSRPMSLFNRLNPNRTGEKASPLQAGFGYRAHAKKPTSTCSPLAICAVYPTEPIESTSNFEARSLRPAANCPPFPRSVMIVPCRCRLCEQDWLQQSRCQQDR
jgi:hypothetical protein